MEQKKTPWLGILLFVATVGAVSAGVYYGIGIRDRKKKKGNGNGGNNTNEQQDQPLDYTTYASIKDVPEKYAKTGAWMNNRDTLWGLGLGQKVVVRKNTNGVMTRMNDQLEKKGEVALSVKRNLGTVWGYWGGKVIVRASAGYDYPFYWVEASDIEGSANFVGDNGDVMKSNF